MKFREPEVENLDLSNCDNVFNLIVKYLCGERYHHELSSADRELLTTWLAKARNQNLNCEQFNELLLLLNQDMVHPDFFRFFFGNDQISLDDLKAGTVKLRGFAMLAYGDFRFAYKRLIEKDNDGLMDELQPFCDSSGDCLESFTRRPNKVLEINKIDRDKTWLLGEISGAVLSKEAEVLKSILEQEESDSSPYDKDELVEFQDALIRQSNEMYSIQEKALRNTDIYLTWDYMDVYVATSMRNRWEYEETYDFLEAVFGKNKSISDLRLRYFDPTQCKCSNPRDKGLIEGLMLKRSLCTIYLAQESDTMGKDSELATTLAQSKPVIAYVPKHTPLAYSRKIKKYDLSYFKKRLLVLEAEGVFDNQELIQQLYQMYPDFDILISQFLDELDAYRQTQPFTLWLEKELEFKRKSRTFTKVCHILAEAECFNFDVRAMVMRERHPLAMQVDLEFGVASGVLVVRSWRECARLLNKILLNKMEFSIKQKEGEYTYLEENISGSPFRVVTQNEKLANSFWNLFPD